MLVSENNFNFAFKTSFTHRKLRGQTFSQAFEGTNKEAFVKTLLNFITILKK